jgi:hypothetical protein
MQININFAASFTKSLFYKFIVSKNSYPHDTSHISNEKIWTQNLFKIGLFILYIIV